MSLCKGSSLYLFSGPDVNFHICLGGGFMSV